MSKALAVSLIIISFVMGMGAGYTFTPEYNQAMQSRQDAMAPLGKADRFFDQRFLNGVIAHHLSAIDMAKQALENSKRKEVRDLAKEIIKVDEDSIEQLSSYKQKWYNDSSVVTKFNRVNLGDSDEKFDLRFLNALIAHHDEAIEISKEVLGKSTRNEVLDLANGINKGLSDSKVVLQSWRKDWYAID